MVLVVGLVLFVAAVLTPTKLPRLRARTCSSPSVVDVAVDRAVDQSVSDIFGIEQFITKHEWSAVRDKVRAGQVGIIHDDASGFDSAIFLEPSRSLAHSPMLIKVIGTRLDASVTNHPRRGLWLVDYCANGTIDRVVDYGEGDTADAAGPVLIYYASFAYSQPGVIVTTIPMATSDYEYVQDANEWDSRFRGNGSIYMFYYSYARRALVAFNEAPFCFYDLDGDGIPEIALRLEIPLQLSWIRSRLLAARYVFDRFWPLGPIATVRYSFNLDNTPKWDASYHYDFSVTGVGTMVPSAAPTTRFRFRRIVTEAVVACDAARAGVERAEWRALSLTWNEDDLNYAEDDPEKRHRWEGVINRGSTLFPQVGGPPSRRFNTRTEIAPESGRRMRLYYSEVDRRIHLFGATVGCLRIDYDPDGKMDMQVRYEDTKGSGVFDKWEVDVDGDGTYERVYVAPDARVTPLDWDYSRLASFYRAQRQSSIAEYEETIRRIKDVIGRGAELPIERYYFGKLRQDDRVARRFQSSLEAKRFYLSVMLELYFRELRTWLKDRKFPGSDIEEIERLFGAGRYHEMLRALDLTNRRRQPITRADR